MSVLIMAVAASVVATVEEAIEMRVKLNRIARALPRRAKQYKFN